MRPSRAHPHIRIRRIPHSPSHSHTPPLPLQSLEHVLSADEDGAGGRNVERIGCPVVVAACLKGCARRLAAGDDDAVEGRYFGWGEVVERGVDVPSHESSRSFLLVSTFVVSISIPQLILPNHRPMKRRMRRMTDPHLLIPIGKSISVLRRDVSVADELDLGNVWDVFDSGMENYGACGGGGVVVMAVGGLGRVEGLEMKGT